MSAELKPTGLEPEYLRECIDVLSDDPPILRWRARPSSHFPAATERVWQDFEQDLRRPDDQAASGRAAARDSRRRQAPDARRQIDHRRDRRHPDWRQAGRRRRVRRTTASPRLREIAGSGPLAAVMQAAMAETGRSMDDLTVMSEDADPYRLDTPAKHRDAQWFAAQVERFIAPDKRIHVRGVFYACVSAGDVMKPDGEPFENTAENEEFRRRAASRYARWLGYVPFERLVDNKNDAPIVRPAPSNDAPTAHVWADDLDIEDLDADALGVSAGLADFEPRQPYRLVFFGEKTSLEDVLGPLAVEFSADLYLMSGQISDTYLHQMARDAVADGRPLVVFTFSRLRPGGILGHADRHRAQAAGAARSPVPDAASSPSCMRRSAPIRCASSTCRRRR